MKRPFIVLKEIIAIAFFIIGLVLTIYLLKYTKPEATQKPAVITSPSPARADQ